MAELAPNIEQSIWNSKQGLLNIINIAKLTEFTILSIQGEINETISVLEELQTVVDKSIDRFSRLSILQIRIAEAQPDLSQDMLVFLIEAIAASEASIPALSRSIEEIRRGFNL
jgi:hypothetical protein